jgi:hypothetical protein
VWPGRLKLSPPVSRTVRYGSQSVCVAGLHELISLPLSGTGHRNSPIVIGGRIIVPEGDANDHSRSGQIEIYHLPGS